MVERIATPLEVANYGHRVSSRRVQALRGGRCSLGYAPFAEMVPITVILNSVTVFARMKMEGS